MMMLWKVLGAVAVLAWLPHLGLAQPCEVSPSFVITVVSTPSVCADRTGTKGGTELSAAFKFSYTSVGGNPVFTATLDADFPCVISVENRTLVAATVSGSAIAQCRLSSDSNNQIGTHAVSLKAEYDGVFPCAGGIEYATAEVQVEAPASIAVSAAPVETSVCPGSKEFTVIFGSTGGQRAYSGELVHSAVLDDNFPCVTRSDKGTAGIITSITATCTTEDSGGFTIGSHMLTLQASASDTNLTGCGAPPPVTIQTPVVVLDPPSITLRPLKLQEATCYNSRSLNIKFSYNITNAGNSPKLSGVTAMPKLLGSKVRPGAVSQIKCKPSLQESTSTSGQILVTCSGDFAKAGAASLTVKAGLAATCSFFGGRSSGSISSNSSSKLEHSTRVLSLRSAAAETNLPGSNLLRTSNSPALDNAAASGAEQAPPASVATTKQSAKSRNALSCCLTEVMAYGFTNRAGQSKCFKHVRPGGGRCTQAEGFYMQGPVDNAVMRMVPQSARLDKPTTNADCAGGVDVGTVSATCLDQKTMQIQVQTRRIDTINRQLFYLDCVPPRATQCPSRQWFAPGTPSTSDEVYRYTTLVTDIPGKCKCTDAYWAVYEQGTFRGLPRSDCKSR